MNRGKLGPGGTTGYLISENSLMDNLLLNYRSNGVVSADVTLGYLQEHACARDGFSGSHFVWPRF